MRHTLTGSEVSKLFPKENLSRETNRGRKSYDACYKYPFTANRLPPSWWSGAYILKNGPEETPPDDSQS